MLVMISSISAPICNVFHARRANSGKKPLLKGYTFLTLACAGLFEPKGPVKKLLKFTFNAENFTCYSCLGL